MREQTENILRPESSPKAGNLIAGHRKMSVRAETPRVIGRALCARVRCHYDEYRARIFIASSTARIKQMPLSNYALETFVAQGLSELTSPTAKPVGAEFESSGGWLGTFVMQSIFTRPIAESGARLAFVWLRRVNAAIENYDEACASLTRVAERTNTISEYFRALGKMETAIAMIYQANQYATTALGIRMFEKGDGTPLSRLNAIYNATRHPNLSTLSEGHLHPVWLLNDGVHSAGATVQYVEIESLIREMAAMADQIVTAAQSPAS
jgi:hypothetical protein